MANSPMPKTPFEQAASLAAFVDNGLDHVRAALAFFDFFDFVFRKFFFEQSFQFQFQNFTLGLLGALFGFSLSGFQGFFQVVYYFFALRFGTIFRQYLKFVFDP